MILKHPFAPLGLGFCDGLVSRGLHPWLLTDAPLGLGKGLGGMRSGARAPVGLRKHVGPCRFLSRKAAEIHSQGREPLVMWIAIGV
jgi:hypothetical protein